MEPKHIYLIAVLQDWAHVEFHFLYDAERDPNIVFDALKDVYDQLNNHFLSFPEITSYKLTAINTITGERMVYDKVVNIIWAVNQSLSYLIPSRTRLDVQSGYDLAVNHVKWAPQMTTGVRLADLQPVVEYLAAGSKAQINSVRDIHNNMCTDVARLLELERFGLPPELVHFLYVASHYQRYADQTGNIKANKFNVYYPLRHSLNDIYQHLTAASRGMLLDAWLTMGLSYSVLDALLSMDADIRFPHVGQYPLAGVGSDMIILIESRNFGNQLYEITGSKTIAGLAKAIHG